MFDKTVLVKLQKLASEYKRADLPNTKISKLWEIGDYLIKIGLTSQGDFWKIQKQDVFVSRAILLRSYWVRKAFTKSEVEKINLNISKILPVLPYLAPKSKKLSPKEKQVIKKKILHNEIPTGIKLAKKSKQRKIETLELVKRLNLLIKTIESEKISLFKKQYPKQNFEHLKRQIIDLLQGALPTEKHTDSLEHAKSFALNIDPQLSEIFDILYIAAKKTRTDSRRMQKRVFDPYLISPFVDQLFFKKKEI